MNSKNKKIVVGSSVALISFGAALGLRKLLKRPTTQEGGAKPRHTGTIITSDSMVSPFVLSTMNNV